MNLNWFLSRKVRHADQMAKHVQKMLNAQRDILSPEAIASVDKAIKDVHAAARESRENGVLDDRMKQLETVANKWLRHYPSPALRENVEVLLVAIAVAMGIRTFFVQPFKIPTGSMQPTLYGITPSFYAQQDSNFVQPPNFASRFLQYWISGISYTHIVAKSDGAVEAVDPAPKKFLLFNLKQSFRTGGESYTVWFPPEDMLIRAGLADSMGRPIPREFKRGEDIIKLRVIAGDHLFVDRMTYNFRRPKRGEIIVFQTKGIEGILAQDQFYIKRMVALGNERVRIGNDRHLRINGKRLEASTPHFENVYSFEGPPRESTYSGHVNQAVANEIGAANVARLFPDETAEVHVPPNSYMVMGDNTLNSSDSRTWGAFSEENVIGKSFFVYWPIGRQGDRPSRFGWGVR